MTDATNLKDALVQLREGAGISAQDLDEAQRGARDLFVWNIAQDNSEIDGWDLLSDQFVQIGEDHQLAIGMWRSEADATLVRVEIQAHRNFDALVTALTTRLASVQIGGFIRDDPQLLPGLRFVSDPPASVIRVLGNLIVDLLLIDDHGADLLALSDILIQSILGQGDDIAEELNPLTDESAFESNPVRMARAPGERQPAPGLDELLAEPVPSFLEQPVTRGDRPERVVVSSPGGQVHWSKGRMNGIADSPGRTEATVTLKPHGQKRLRRLKIQPPDGRAGRGETTP